ncbi:type III secretion protein [Proteus sp. GOKU]|uniref:FliM/FliN family flagellar motor switch protein n=1 Tax=Proteus TaxID=583 RepID=UPI0018929D67|nr:MULTISPECIES: FliM/FliN family flagellar motor switch protein [Proteus]QPB80921.1 type III secretion protein [Proteus sp. GOKU]QQP26928.1 type III secretion protein [Proteus vulgaris]
MIRSDPENSINNKEDSYSMDILSSLYTSQLPISSAHYFKIKGNNTLGSFTGIVEVSQVMDKIYPEKKIDWELIPETYLYTLFSQKCSQILFPFSKEPMPLIIDNICLGEQEKLSYPVINTEIGDIFICSFDKYYEWTLSSKNKISAIAQYKFGKSTMSFSLLKTLSLGDIVLIDSVDFSLIIGEKKWMRYQWQEGENAVILDEKLFANETEREESVEDTEITLQKNIELKAIQSIPVTLSFLLANKTMLLEQIEELSPGQQITLPDNALRHITLIANGVAIAQGELIKVGERLAVEIQRAYLKQD